ncbi:MAG: hypothetical protein LQ346_004098 [Caloplaca aetnensis]|nr:MAG: hypothetical protein LQ346_004098 [Caloplaca aetnensis]
MFPSSTRTRLLLQARTLARRAHNLSPPPTPLHSLHPTMPPPIHLILDWDGTLTTTSTLPLIARIGYARNPSLPLPSWDTISEAYMTDYRVHASAYSPSPLHRKAVKQEIAWLESLRDVERKSMERAEAAGLFKGVDREDVRRAAQRAVREGEVLLRKGWSGLVGRVLQEGGKVGVVSVGWSGDFIRGCLRTATEDLEGEEELPVEDIDVRTNEILGGEGKMSRYFEEKDREGSGGIWIAGDKVRVMHELVATKPRGPDSVVVYVGDSATDFDCLLAADLGICVRNEGEMSGEQTELEKTFRRLAIGCERIGQIEPKNLKADFRPIDHSTSKRLWSARNFDEILNSPLYGVATPAETNKINCLWTSS